MILLCGQFLTYADTPLSNGRTGSEQLASGAPRKPLESHRREQVGCDSELGPGIGPTAFSPKPFAVEEVPPRKFCSQPRVTEPSNRLSVEAVGVFALGAEGLYASFDTHRPVIRDRRRPFPYPAQRVVEECGISRSRCSFGELSDHQWAVADHVALD